MARLDIQALNQLLDNRSDPDVRTVLEDYEMEHGLRSTRLGIAIAAADVLGGDGDDDDAAEATAGDDVDDATAGDDVDADDADVGASADVAIADRGGGDREVERSAVPWDKELDLRNGLKIIQLRGRYGWAVTILGWLRRDSGDEWEIVNARTVRRTDGARTLASLAHRGPGDDHILSEQSEVIEETNRLLILRCLRANEAVWGPLCPRPADWRDE